ncbi:hypothetical protein DSUL_20117 [Desulfovibrionales bacterium]
MGVQTPQNRYIKLSRASRIDLETYSKDSLSCRLALQTGYNRLWFTAIPELIQTYKVSLAKNDYSLFKPAGAVAPFAIITVGHVTKKE